MTKEISKECPICKTKLHKYEKVTSRCPFTDQIENCHYQLYCKSCGFEMTESNFKKLKN